MVIISVLESPFGKGWMIYEGKRLTDWNTWMTRPAFKFYTREDFRVTLWHSGIVAAFKCRL